MPWLGHEQQHELALARLEPAHGDAQRVATRAEGVGLGAVVRQPAHVAHPVDVGHWLHPRLAHRDAQRHAGAGDAQPAGQPIGIADGEGVTREQRPGVLHGVGGVDLAAHVAQCGAPHQPVEPRHQDGEGALVPAGEPGHEIRGAGVVLRQRVDGHRNPLVR